MDRSTVKKLISKKARDYSYAIAFFFTFSFFAVFVIRPNVLNVFSTFVEIEELKKIEKVYDNQIGTILMIQSDLETYRPDLVYVDESLSSTPLVNKVLSDVNDAALKNTLNIVKLDINDVDLKSNTERKLTPISVEVDGTGSFENIYGFLKDTYNQRRLKLARDIKISRDVSEDATASSDLIIQMQIEGFYL